MRVLRLYLNAQQAFGIWNKNLWQPEHRVAILWINLESPSPSLAIQPPQVPRDTRMMMAVQIPLRVQVLLLLLVEAVSRGLKKNELSIQLIPGFAWRI
ncbi:hypothetical protein D3C87_1944450 [compost metagenome]